MKHNLTVNVKHICGHEEVHELIGAREDSRRTRERIRELANKDCTACEEMFRQKWLEKWLPGDLERRRQDEIEDEMFSKMRWDSAHCRYVVK